jgi:hypothetical protein
MNLKEKYNKRKIIIIFKEKKRRSIEKWGRKEEEREREREKRTKLRRLFCTSSAKSIEEGSDAEKELPKKRKKELASVVIDN